MNFKLAFAKVKRAWTVFKRRASLKCKKLPTIICADCVGGVIYHDLSQQFLSPTINLYMKIEDFLTLCENLSKYCGPNATLKEIPSEFTYPIGLLQYEGLPDIRLFFMHYSSFEQAQQKWVDRCKRINYENIVLILPMLAETGKVEKILERFNKLPYQKVALLNATQELVENSFRYSKEQFDYEGTENLLSYRANNKFWQWRYLDYFDYVEFINTGRICEKRLK